MNKAQLTWYCVAVVPAVQKLQVFFPQKLHKQINVLQSHSRCGIVSRRTSLPISAEKLLFLRKLLFFFASLSLSLSVIISIVAVTGITFVSKALSIIIKKKTFLFWVFSSSELGSIQLNSLNAHDTFLTSSILMRWRCNTRWNDKYFGFIYLLLFSS